MVNLLDWPSAEDPAQLYRISRLNRIAVRDPA
jgi:hypothetical protein